MRVAVAGGTGVAGRLAVALRGAGHVPVVLARSTGVELVSGAGLADALAGVDAVIDASNISAQRAAIVWEFFEATGGGLPGPGLTLGAQTFADWLRSQAAHPSSVSPATGAS
jgi:hypothetical protein